jgi:gamma-glutamyltranspeptidase/glutathione hydrolase
MTATRGEGGAIAVSGQRGAIATSHPQAAQAGQEMLEAGGSAADAAVAAAAVLCVVDPRSTGIGGDVFALHWAPGAPAPVGLSAAGGAPAGLTLAALRDAGFQAMPAEGPWTITVPGAVAGWEALLARFGRMDLERVLQPAIALADDGFAVSPMIAEEWATCTTKLSRDRAATTQFLPGGRPPRSGERFANPDFGAALRAIATGGAAAFYQGDIAGRIGAAVEACGGPLRASDLEAWAGPDWVVPITTSFAGHDIFELPPPNQGIVVLEALNIYARAGQDCGEDEHTAIEAVKLAIADAAAHVADPLHAAVPTDAMLSPAYADRRRSEIEPGRAGDAVAGRPGDTVYVAVATRDAGCCSFIQSVYEGFGSGIGVPGLGITLQNRGAGFVMDEVHPNCVAPGKRPFHTIIPAMVGESGAPLAALGVVGGFMQPQGQLQILRSVLEGGADPQAAVSAPRWRAVAGRRLAVEPGFDRRLAEELAARGHAIEPLARFEAGGAQLAMRRDGAYAAGSDPRKDGVALGW